MGSRRGSELRVGDQGYRDSRVMFVNEKFAVMGVGNLASESMGGKVAGQRPQ